MLFSRCKCLCRSSKIWWSIKVVWWWTSCILAFINLILPIVKFLKQQIQLNTQRRGGSLKLNCCWWCPLSTVAPSPSVDINTTLPLWLHTFLAALVSTLIGTVFLKPTHSYKKALGLISQSMLTMSLVNFIPSPLPTVSLAYIYAHMYTSLR